MKTLFLSLWIQAMLSVVVAWVVPYSLPANQNSGSTSSLNVVSDISSTSSDDSTLNRINPLIRSIQPSKTVEIFSLVEQLRADGETVTSLCVGEPDFPPFPAILQAIKDATDAGLTRYTAVTGTLDLRKSIALDLEKRKNLQYDPKSEIVVSNGAKQCVFQALMALAGTNDIVLVPSPYWPSYPEEVRLTGAEPVIVQTTAEDGYLLTPATLRAALNEHGEKCKVLILCHPSNPTGAVYSSQQLQALAEVLQDFPTVSVLADEIYERLVYNNDDGTCASMAQIPTMKDRTVVVNGFSKAYAMTGLRIGYLAASQPVAKAVSTIQSQLTSCAGSISQAAAVAALQQVHESEIAAAVSIMRNKRDYVLGRLEQIEGVTVPVRPDGAFYILVQIDECKDKDDANFCVQLLQQEKLALVPGSSFGEPGTVRISYATSTEELDTALQKLERFLKFLKNTN